MNYPLRREYLTSYDIQDNKVRKHLSDELGKNGLKPVQKSVFWGYLTHAEMELVKRCLNSLLEKTDKALITHTNFNGRGQSYTIGHHCEDFQDWQENVII